MNAVPALSRRQLLAAGAALGMAGRAAAEPPRPASDLLTLATSDGRGVAVWSWRARRPRATILFSHGALSAPWKYTALIEPWTLAGYDVFAPLHVDSTDHPDTKKYPGLASWRTRLEDMQLLTDHLRRDRYVAAGHSYGGLVALTLGGAGAVRPEGYAGPMRDRRAQIVVAFSPPGPAPGLIDTAGYATLAVPAFIETGDHDIPPGGALDGWKAHLAAYDAAAAGGDRYGLILEGADHYFGNIICRPERAELPQTVQFAAANRLATLFIKGFADGDPAARRMLDAQLADSGPVRLMRR